ncbi:ATP-binding cassette domain-containing protein [Corynebacterium kroppenstedtii]|uniref:ABC-type transport system, ATP-binding protein n=1 Tax=Corynebacterium kroppenstedtii (strain DSM 44385 / JCM 11950 / CIP 105744 / CCUG 35717) TaxID=645127 RepID=C4LKT8_CORK4|nr:ABC-type transport system, ATP-binding protein [Corynebacterium kroppenstedtii DSM 44385]QRP10223.1 ATP-binding cassette domain-containing protein [Corynebacterium kroppenstedtii]
MKEFVCAPSGSGMSEEAWALAEDTGAAWVGNDAAAHITLLRSTVEQELAFGMEQMGVPVPDMRARIQDVAGQWGLTTLLQRDPSKLSTGQTRRVAIASALLRNPDNLVLDCPLDGCDMDATRALVQVVDSFPGDVTIFDRTWNHLADLCDVESRYPGGVGLNPVAGAAYDSPVELSKTPDEDSAGGSDAESADFTHSAHAPSPVLMINDLVVERHAFTLGPLSAGIPRGITHIAGPNGTGKTTLLLALADLIEHSGGSQQVVAPPHPLHYGWAPTSMDTSFSAKTVRDEIAIGSTLRNADALIEYCGLEDVGGVHPLDVASSARRIVSVACALARGPEFLFLDEPTVGLDVYGYRTLERIMRGFVAGEIHDVLRAHGGSTLGEPKSVVWTCHNGPYSELSDYRLVL